MGEVLRVMDRGISSADSVVNYLVLFLGPSLAECVVTLIVFFTKFDSPPLSAVALLSFAVYVTLTVQITQWRKKFRTGQNKQDNKYHDLATDRQATAGPSSLALLHIMRWTSLSLT